MMQSAFDPSELASYAVADSSVRGRVYPETDEHDDSPFELDRYRILSCMAFRRLMHKTQVFVTGGGDHFRTRLTHTLEVAIQAQRLAASLHLNTRLSGAIALAHDLGHPPFGHAGEMALAQHMKEDGGFEHNLQSLRVVDYLEHPYPAFRGLNLSFELRESLIKHQTLYDRPDASVLLSESSRALLADGPLPPLEGQVVNLADMIAYTLHDIEDGLVQNVLTEAILNKSRLWCRAAAPIRQCYPSHPIHAVRRPIIDKLAVQLADDVAQTSRQQFESVAIQTVDDARHHETALITFSSEMQTDLSELQGILHEYVYRHHGVVRMDAKARRLIQDLFEAYQSNPSLMPERYTSRIDEQGRNRVICDYIAGMTDRFCQQEHQRLFAPFHFE